MQISQRLQFDPCENLSTLAGAINETEEVLWLPDLSDLPPILEFLHLHLVIVYSVTSLSVRSHKSLDARFKMWSKQ